MLSSNVGQKSKLSYVVIKKEAEKAPFAWKIKNFPNLFRGLWRVKITEFLGLPNFYGKVYLTLIKANGQKVDYGLVSYRVVTDTGVAAIVDAFQNIVELEEFKYHGIGTGISAEAVTQTALVTELTSSYTTDDTRATGTTEEGTNGNIFKSVATNNVDGTVALREHGIFNNATSGSGTMLDRTLFAAINLSSGDSIETTYELTFAAGS